MLRLLILSRYGPIYRIALLVLAQVNATMRGFAGQAGAANLRRAGTEVPLVIAVEVSGGRRGVVDLLPERGGQLRVAGYLGLLMLIANEFNIGAAARRPTSRGPVSLGSLLKHRLRHIDDLLRKLHRHLLLPLTHCALLTRR